MHSLTPVERAPRALAPAPRPVGEDEAGDEIQLREVGLTLVRNRWLVLGAIVAAMALAAFLTWRQDPIYMSEAVLRIDDQDPGQNLLSELAPVTGARRGKIETEMVVLRSRRIAEGVVDSMDLTVRLLEPAVPRDEVLQVLAAGREDPSGTFELTHRTGGAYALSMTEGTPIAGLPREVRVGQPFRIGTVALALAPAVASSPPSTIRFRLLPYRGAVSALRGSLVVARPDPSAFIVELRFQSIDRLLAAAVPNAIANLYVQQKVLGSKTESRSTVNFLRDQVASYEGQLAAAENQLRSFREQQHVVNLGEEASQSVRRLADLQAEHDRLRSERETLTKLLAQVSSTPRGPEGVSPYRQLASFPVFLSNRTVQDMLQSLTALENERAQLLVRRTEANDEVRGFDRRIQEMELQLYRIAQNYLESVDTQIASAEASLGRFGTTLEAIPSREVEFARLSRQQDLLASIYNLLQTRLKEAEIREAVEPGDVRVIDLALVPTAPISPRPLRNLVLGGFLGMLLGIGLAFAREALDTKVRRREDVTGATSGAPILGMIPRIRVASASNGHALTNGNGKKARNGIIPVSPQTLLEERLITRLDPRSPASEAYRALRTNITFANSERVPQVLVITSALPGDGKSTSASNLAITLAQQGTRTLLVDADLRRGVLHKVFDVHQEPGLTHVLLGKAELRDAVQHIDAGDTAGRLDFLAAGVFPPNPAELLGSSRMREFLQRVRDEYEMVIFDAPPLNLVTDAAVLGTAADATVLVARAGTTDKRALQHAAAQLYHLGAPMGGVVLNDIDVTGGDRYYGYGYGYGYGYSYRYGGED